LIFPALNKWAKLPPANFDKTPRRRMVQKRIFTQTETGEHCGIAGYAGAVVRLPGAKYSE